ASAVVVKSRWWREVPSKEAKAQLHIRVLDMNDHCPVFHSPDSRSVLFVNMSMEVNTTVVVIKVTDDDFGDNGEVALNFAASADNVVHNAIDVDINVPADRRVIPRRHCRQGRRRQPVLPPDVEPLKTITTSAPLELTTTTISDATSSGVSRVPWKSSTSDPTTTIQTTTAGVRASTETATMTTGSDTIHHVTSPLSTETTSQRRDTASSA
ncbi:hypothetical protein LSAT2_005157, partial [Lamellibrachia satsuma]